MCNLFVFWGRPHLGWGEYLGLAMAGRAGAGTKHEQYTDMSRTLSACEYQAQTWTLRRRGCAFQHDVLKLQVLSKSLRNTGYPRTYPHARPVKRMGLP